MNNKNWFRRHWIISTILALFLLPIIFSSFSDTREKAKVAVENQAQETDAFKEKIVFDIRGLSNSKIEDVVARLGEPKRKYMPTAKDLKEGENPDYTYEKDKEMVIITYDNKSRKAVDFFISGGTINNQADSEDEKRNLLNKLNVTLGTSEYETNFKIALANPKIFTGVLLTRLDPFKAEKEYNARFYSSNFVKNMVITGYEIKYNTPTYAKKKGDNVYLVSSSIEGKNAFGVKMEKYWEITLKYMGEEKAESIDYISYPNNWKVIEVIFDGKAVK